ncbi:MAG TPA: hypothetical protein VGD83_37595 [Streptosporangiaceae bacterium]
MARPARAATDRGRDLLPAGAGRVRLAWADAGHAGKLATWAASLKIQLKIVRKRDAHAFEVLPRRWVVGRTLAWIIAHRRCARDYERVPEGYEAMVLWAVAARITQHLATQRP